MSKSSKIETAAKKQVDREAAQVKALQKKLTDARARLKKSREQLKVLRSLKRKQAPKRKKPAAPAAKRAKKAPAWTLEDMVRLTKSSMDIKSKDEEEFYSELYKRFGKSRTRTAVVRKAKAMDIAP